MTTPPPQAPDATALVIQQLTERILYFYAYPVDEGMQEAVRNAITHLAAHAELQARCARLEDSLADMVDMSETLIKNIAEFSKDSRILTAKSPRLEIARALLTARTAKEATP